MRKIAVFSVLFVIIAGCLYGQITPENGWISGRWTGDYRGFDNKGSIVNYNIEILLNDDGTGICNDGGFAVSGNDNFSVLRSGDIIFSIYGNRLTVFTSIGNALIKEFIVYRINDQRLILRYRDNGFVNLNKDMNKEPLKTEPESFEVPDNDIQEK